MLNKASKVEEVLNAWLEFIALEDLSNAKVPGNEAVLRGVQLVGDCVRIEQATFSDLQQALQEERGRQDTTWVLSFPRISTVNRGQSELCPLFSLDATSILKGEYREEGWNLNDLELTEAGKNLATFLELDEEQCEQLITQEGLRRFLDTTFGLNFDTYEDWMRCVNIPRSYQIQRQPYLFRFQGSGFSWNLKRDLKDIKSHRGNWLKQGYPADEYLFGAPKLPEHEVTYMGAFPTHPPTDSQLKALKHTTSQPLTAVQGPPGSGKTTLILHVIAQQVVKRALILIEKGE
ncbi:MAG: AAA domain-containing protein, partial [Cyanobacteriota bacterium]